MTTSLQLPPIQQRHSSRLLILRAGLALPRPRAAVVKITRPSLSPTPQDIAKDNKVTDAVLQAWADLGGPLSLPKHYTPSKDLLLSSYTHINGYDGLGGLHFPNSGAINLRNRNFAFPGTVPIDQNITLNGVDLSGDPNGIVPPNITNIVFIGVNKLKLHNCIIHDFRRHAVTLSNCPNYSLTNNEIFNYGEVGTYSGKPEDWFAGCGLFCITPCDDGTFTHNRIHDGTGIGAWFDGGAKGLQCMFNKLARVAEAGFVGWPDGAMVFGNRGDIVTRPAISGHWIEGQGNNVTIQGNRFTLAAGACIFGTDVQGWIIADNYLSGANQQPLAMTAPIILRTANPDPNTTTRDTSITGNQIGTMNGKAGNAITIVNWSGNEKALMHNLSIACNNTGDPAQYTGSQPLLMAPLPDKPSGKSLVLGDHCSIAGNPGIADRPEA